MYHSPICGVFVVVAYLSSWWGVDYYFESIPGPQLPIALGVAHAPRSVVRIWQPRWLFRGRSSDP